MAVASLPTLLSGKKAATRRRSSGEALTSLPTKTDLCFVRSAAARQAHANADADIATRLAITASGGGATAYWKNGGTLEKAPSMVNHAGTRTS
jgi:hypothetical protein